MLEKKEMLFILYRVHGYLYAETVMIGYMVIQKKLEKWDG
jgi:hypothetical protein